MKAKLLWELSMLFRDEAEAIVQPYAWPPRAPLSDQERREVERLCVTAARIRYRAGVAEYEEQRTSGAAAAKLSCCEICDRSPVCGVDCGSCTGSWDDVLRDVERGVAQSGSAGAAAPAQDRSSETGSTARGEQRAFSPTDPGSSPGPALDDVNYGQET